LTELLLSTVTPVYTGQNSLERLVKELEELKNELEKNASPVRLAETIFVDDGSVDNSHELLKQIDDQYDWVQVITLSKNFGQHPATMAGILHSSGDWIVTLDEDLQHRPKFIMDLLKEAVLDNKDIVYAQPINPVHNSLFRDQSSRLYKWVISKLSGNKYIKKFNSFRLIRGEIARATAAVSIDQTYYDMALIWFTDRIGFKPVVMEDIRFKKNKSSGYNFLKLLSHAKKMLLSSNFKVLRIGSLFGFLAMLIALMVAIYTLIIRIYIPELVTPGWASIMISILFLGGMNALLLGLVLEHLSIILMQNHGKPTYFKIDRSQDKWIREWFLSNQK